MIRSKLFNVLFLILSVSSTLSAKPAKVTYADVRKTMTKMFAYHVDFKSFTPELAKRSLRICIEQFDSNKEYFLAEEISEYMNITQNGAQELVSDFYYDRYPVYQSLNGRMEKAISRHRKIRSAVCQEFVQGTLIEVSETDTTRFATNYSELESRIRYKYAKILIHYEKRNGGKLSKESKAKIVKKLDKKIRWYEATYVGKYGLEESVAIMVLKSMAKSLDAHTAYYTPDEARDLRTALKKQFEGLGVVLREADDGIVVVDLIAGSPAERSGKIRVGDYLTEIEDDSISELSFEEVLEALKGEKHKSKSLTLKRGESTTIRVSLRPENIVLEDDRASFTTERYGDGVILKIDLPGFYDNGNGVDAESDLQRIFKEVSGMGPVYGLVIDMRTNSGGFLTQAVKVASLFINKGIIVISKYSDGEIRYMRDLDSRPSFTGPIVVLTSKASASAAEILAQALQDYGVALVVGDERTYGKGSMQYQTVTLDNADAYFKVTVGRYYTVSGRSTQIQGVLADVVVPTIYNSLKIGERYLDYPLKADHLDFSHVGKGGTELDRQLAPYFELKEFRWRKMLPELKSNSALRLQNDEGYQCFIKKAKDREFSTIRESCGDVDFQLRESVSILKDMIQMSQNQ